MCIEIRLPNNNLFSSAISITQQKFHKNRESMVFENIFFFCKFVFSTILRILHSLKDSFHHWQTICYLLTTAVAVMSRHAPIFFFREAISIDFFVVVLKAIGIWAAEKSICLWINLRFNSPSLLSVVDIQLDDNNNSCNDGLDIKINEESVYSRVCVCVCAIVLISLNFIDFGGLTTRSSISIIFFFHKTLMFDFLSFQKKLN